METKSCSKIQYSNNVALLAGAKNGRVANRAARWHKSIYTEVGGASAHYSPSNAVLRCALAGARKQISAMHFELSFTQVK